jgi:hypothetical protein
MHYFWRLRSAFVREPVLYTTLVVCAVVGFGLRVCVISQPIRYDEAVTFLGVCEEGLDEVLSNYNQPNNHILHSLLAWISTRILGDSLIAIRLPALIAGLLVIPVTFVLGLRLYGRTAACIAAALVATDPQLIEYSANARGYSLMTCLFLLIAVCLTKRRYTSTGVVVLSALGLYTSPVMLYPMVSLGCWVIINSFRYPRKKCIKFMGKCLRDVVLVGMLTIGLYSPVYFRYWSWSPLISNRFVQPVSNFDEWLSKYAMLLIEIFEELCKSYAMWMLLVMCVALLVDSCRVDRRGRPSLISVSFIAGTLLTLALLVDPFPRLFQYWIPVAAIAVGGTLSAILVSLRRGITPAIGAFLILLITIPLRSRESMLSINQEEKMSETEEVLAFIAENRKQDDALVLGLIPKPIISYYANIPLERQNAKGISGRALIVTLAPEQVSEALRRNRFDVSDFSSRRLLFRSGRASIYEIFPREGTVRRRQK